MKKYWKSIAHVLYKDEVADIILTAIYLDEQVVMPDDQPLKHACNAMPMS